MTGTAFLDPRTGFPDENNPLPLYLQLQNRIREAVRLGELGPGDALPSERELAASLAVSRVTVRKAVRGLVAEGVLTQRWGSGTFIAGARKVEQPLSRLTGFTDDMRARGMVPAALWLDRSVGLPSPAEAMALNLSPAQPVSRLHRLRTADGMPMAIEHAVVPCRFLPDPAAVTDSLYDVLAASGNRPFRALQRLHAVLLTAEQAGLLEVPPATPGLSIERRSFLRTGEPVEFTRSVYRGDTYDFIAELYLADHAGHPAPEQEERL